MQVKLRCKPTNRVHWKEEEAQNLFLCSPETTKSQIKARIRSFATIRRNRWFPWCDLGPMWLVLETEEDHSGRGINLLSWDIASRLRAHVGLRDLYSRIHLRHIVKTLWFWERVRVTTILWEGTKPDKCFLVFIHVTLSNPSSGLGEPWVIPTQSV